MTRYSLSADPDTGKPCMVMDPEGIWCCVGEVDRTIRNLEALIDAYESRMEEHKDEQTGETQDEQGGGEGLCLETNDEWSDCGHSAEQFREGPD
jgi:hypothetical protein